MIVSYYRQMIQPTTGRLPAGKTIRQVQICCKQQLHALQKLKMGPPGPKTGSRLSPSIIFSRPFETALGREAPYGTGSGFRNSPQ